MRTLPLRIELRGDGRARYCTWFPMPFWEFASVRLVNGGAKPTGPIAAKVSVGAAPASQNRCGYFTTRFNQGRTIQGSDWRFFEGVGTGWFAGVVQTMFGGHYCEGDEHIAIDGAVSPQINGTGSEDYYLGCFWPNAEYNSPFANCVGDAREEGGGTFEGSCTVPACYSRFHLEAPLPFFAHLDARIQHGGNSTFDSCYGSLAFLYLQRRPVLLLTDQIDVGSRLSEKGHGYETQRASAIESVTARPEGNACHTTLRETGRIHRGGEIAFTVAIDPCNEGVRLRRRLDQGLGRQKALVYLDGELAGTWYHADGNEFLRWYDSDFDIHPRLTQDKDRIEVVLKLEAGEEKGAWTDFRYWVYSFVP